MITIFDKEDLEQMSKEEIIELFMDLQEQYKELENRNSEDYEPIYNDYDF